MLKQLLTKSFLVAAGLCVGASAWAEVIVSFNSGTLTGATAAYAADGTLDSDKYKLASTDNKASTNYVELTLTSGTFQTDDEVSITYYASNTSKSVTPGLFFGTKDGDTFTSKSAIQAAATSAGSGSPATDATLKVLAEGNGTNVLRLTRFTGGTTLYINRIEISRKNYADVKMTYISGSDANVSTSYGEVTTAYCGYNTISAGTVGLGNKGWGVNNIAYLKVDASMYPGKITDAQLTVDCQQISARALNYGIGYNSSEWSTTMTWNTADRSITTLGSVVNGSKTTTDKTITFDITNALKDDADKIATILVYQTAAGGGYVKNPKVTITYSLASDVAYTINYKLGDNVVKTVASTELVGETITAETAVDGTEEGYVGNHYLITAATAPSITLVTDAASNVLNVPVRAPYTTTLTVNKSIGGVAQTPEVITLTETDTKDCSWAYTYNRYVYYNSKYYIADETSSYGWTGTFENGVAIAKNVNYTNEDATIMGYTEMGTGGTNTALSGGATASNNSELAPCTLAAGCYVAEIYVASKAGSGSHTRNEGVWVNDASVISTPTDTYGLVSLPFTIDADDTPVYVKGVASGSSYNSDNLDYVVIRKVSSLSKSITAAGWATYCSPYALDLEHATGLTDAYIVTGGAGGVLTTSSVKGGTVPANTGLLLNGSGECVIPVVASSSTDVRDNKLEGVTTETADVAAGIYVLLNETTGEERGLGFYQTTAPFTLGANTAYLPSGFDSGSAPAFYSLFDSETTGVGATLVNSERVNNEIFNLQGQRVSQPTKGLYIVNGKKIIVK